MINSELLTTLLNVPILGPSSKNLSNVCYMCKCVLMGGFVLFSVDAIKKHFQNMEDTEPRMSFIFFLFK